MKCPKCGYENPDDSLFCEECGEKLDTQKFLCPSCKNEVRKGVKHCKTCGYELTWVDADYDHIPIPVKGQLNEIKKVKKVEKPVIKEEESVEATNNESESKQKLAKDVLYYVSTGILIIGIILSIIGCFGSFMSASVKYGTLTQSADSYPIPYLFKDMFKNFESLKSDEKPFLHLCYLLLGVFTVTSYIEMLLMFVFFSIFAIRCQVKKANNKELSNNFVIGLIIAPLLFLMNAEYTFMVESRTSSTVVATNFGWGTILLIVGLFINIFAFYLNSLKVKEKNNTENILSHLLSYVSVALIVVVALLFTSKLIGVKESGSNTDATGYYRLVIDLTNVMGGAEASSGLGGAIFGMVFTLIAIPMWALSIPLLIGYKKKGAVVTVIITVIISFIAMIITLAAGSIKYNDNTKAEFSLNAYSAFFIALGIISVVLVIIQYVVQNKKKAN